MTTLLKLQLSHSLPKLVFLIVGSIALTLIPLFKLDVYTINGLLLLLFLPISNNDSFLVRDHYYKQLLTAPLRTKAIYQALYMHGFILISMFSIFLLTYNSWGVWLAHGDLSFYENSPLYDAIVISTIILLFLLILISINYFYIIWKGLRVNVGDQMLLYLGVVFLFATPIAYFLFFAENLWPRVIVATIISFTIYYVMYLLTLKVVPQFIVKVDLEEEKEEE